ncbi:MAG: hypothetical protein ACYS76_13380 [Planctomycetota bacterium]|jgi:hypothetical protein
MTTYKDGRIIDLFADHPLVTSSNSGYSMIQWDAGRVTKKTGLNVTGTGSISANVFKVNGAVDVIDTFAEITSVTTLTNATAVYGDLYDGTNTVEITSSTPGATLSGFVAGSIMRKGQLNTAAMTVLNADEVRMFEAANRTAVPFIAVQKAGADTYVRFNLTTTDSPIDFTMDVYFRWRPLDGGSVEAV